MKIIALPVGKQETKKRPGECTFVQFKGGWKIKSRQAGQKTDILQWVSCLSEDGRESLRQLGSAGLETEPPLPPLRVFSSLGGSECKHSSSIF